MTFKIYLLDCIINALAISFKKIGGNDCQLQLEGKYLWGEWKYLNQTLYQNGWQFSTILLVVVPVLLNDFGLARNTIKLKKTFHFEKTKSP